MNETTKRNFFEIMGIAQKYHNATMSGQNMGEPEINGDTGHQATGEALDAKHALICEIVDAGREYGEDANYSEIGANLSEQFDKLAREYASVSI